MTALTPDDIEQIRARHRIISNGSSESLAQGDIKALLGDLSRLLDERDLLSAIAEAAEQRAVHHLASRNRAIKVAHSYVERAMTAESDRTKLLAVLRRHHDWHLNAGTWLVPDGDGSYIEIDNGAEYSDSTMCDETLAALMVGASHG